MDYWTECEHTKIPANAVLEGGSDLALIHIRNTGTSPQRLTGHSSRGMNRKGGPRPPFLIHDRDPYWITTCCSERPSDEDRRRV
jgi:hypothetical protein